MLDYHHLKSPILSMTLIALLGSMAWNEPATAEEPSVAEVHLRKGLKNIQRERYAKAIKELEIARELSQSPCLRCLKGIALSYFLSERFEEAVGAYEELFEMEPDKLAYLRRLTRLYRKLDEPEKAIRAYRTFLESSENSEEMIEIYNELGVRRITLGSGLPMNRNEAIGAFRNALDLAAGRSNRLRRNLAEALWMSGSKEEALSVLKGMTAEGEENWNSLPALQLSSELWARHVQPKLRKPPAEGMIPTTEDKTTSTEGRMSTTQWRAYCLMTRGAAGASSSEGEFKPPITVSSPQPQYTVIARKARVQGTVTVRVVIDKRGRVGDLWVIKGLSMGLDDQAVKATKTWEFLPATLNGEPVIACHDLTVHFRLQ